MVSYLQYVFHQTWEFCLWILFPTIIAVTLIVGTLSLFIVMFLVIWKFWGYVLKNIMKPTAKGILDEFYNNGKDPIVLQQLRELVMGKKKSCSLLPNLNPTENDFKLARDLAYNQAIQDIADLLVAEGEVDDKNS